MNERQTPHESAATALLHCARRGAALSASCTANSVCPIELERSDAAAGARDWRATPPSSSSSLRADCRWLADVPRSATTDRERRSSRGDRPRRGHSHTPTTPTNSDLRSMRMSTPVHDGVDVLIASGEDAYPLATECFDDQLCGSNAGVLLLTGDQVPVAERV
jgi:hypothetical protein